jgi:hypothetical protein
VYGGIPFFWHSNNDEALLWYPLWSVDTNMPGPTVDIAIISKKPDAAAFLDGDSR